MNGTALPAFDSPYLADSNNSKAMPTCFPWVFPDTYVRIRLHPLPRKMGLGIWVIISRCDRQVGLYCSFAFRLKLLTLNSRFRVLAIRGWRLLYSSRSRLKLSAAKCSRVFFCRLGWHLHSRTFIIKWILPRSLREESNSIPIQYRPTSSEPF